MFKHLRRTFSDVTRRFWRGFIAKDEVVCREQYGSASGMHIVL